MFSYRLLLGGLGMAALLGAIAWGIAGPRGGRHLEGMSCGKCHLVDPVASPAQARKLVASQEVICRSCHPKALQMSHPSGFRPKQPLPAEYPADWKGDLTCSSCHDVHGTAQGLLRGNAHGQAMCLACHAKAFFDQMKDRGNSLQQSGHLGAGAAPAGQVEIDAISLQCLGCHENESDAIGVTLGANGLLRHNSGAANHPIGVPYPAYSRNGMLRSRPMLPKPIVLPEGKLACVSCHVAYKKEHGALVMSNEGSALCLQCHQL